MTRHDDLNKEYNTYNRLYNKINDIVAHPSKYTTEELSTLLDGMYTFGNPNETSFTYNKQTIKNEINKRLLK